MVPIKIIEELLNILDPYFIDDKRKDFPLEFTYYHALERIRLNVNSIGTLVKDNLLRHEHAIGLICRNILTDFITMSYVMKFSNSEEEATIKLYLLHNTDLTKVDKEFKKNYQRKRISEETFNKYNERYLKEDRIYKLIREEFRKFYNEKDIFPGTTAIVDKFIKENVTGFWAKRVKEDFSTWFYYSKYEHIGWFSFELTRKITTKEAEKKLIKVLLDALILSGACFQILKETDSMNKCAHLQSKIRDSDF